MKYPSPYFSNLPYIGNLEIDYVFAEYDCPIIFTCIDKDNNIFFCACICMDNIQKWLVTAVDSDTIVDYVKNKVSNREMFTKSNCVYVLSWKYGFTKENCKMLSGDKIPEDELPPVNTFLEADDEEFSDYINVLQNRKNQALQQVFNSVIANHANVVIKLEISYLHEFKFQRTQKRKAKLYVVPTETFPTITIKLKDEFISNEQKNKQNTVLSTINSLKAS